MTPVRSYLVCATPRSGSTLVCQALKATRVAGTPEEYFEALLHSWQGSPSGGLLRAAWMIGRSSITWASAGSADDPPPRSPLWSRTAYDRYLEWAMEAGTTPNGVFGAKLMWGYFGDFVSLLRNVPRYRDLPLAELLPDAFPNLTFIRVVRADKVRQAVSLWKAVQTARWRQAPGARSRWPLGRRWRHASLQEPSSRSTDPSFASTTARSSTCSSRILVEEAFWDAFFEHSRTKPLLVLYENFAADPEVSTLSVLERLELAPPDELQLRAAR